MGFLKFLLAIALCIIGVFLVVGAAGGFLNNLVKADMIGGQHPSAIWAWVVGIIGAIVFLGGIYMLRKK